MARGTALGLAALLAAGSASAHAPAVPPRPATTWVPVEEPMSALLNGGHRIVSASGPSFTLERGGRYGSAR